MSAIPAVVAAERVPGGEANRIVGVVDALKYFDANEGGFGFLRRTGHPVANSREHHVHFRSKDAPEPFSDLKVGMEARAPRLSGNAARPRHNRARQRPRPPPLL